jgi:hypothetical protein
LLHGGDFAAFELCQQWPQNQHQDEIIGEGAQKLAGQQQRKIAAVANALDRAIHADWLAGRGCSGDTNVQGFDARSLFGYRECRDE